jgi:hypothetical protein
MEAFGRSTVARQQATAFHDVWDDRGHRLHHQLARDQRSRGLFYADERTSSGCCGMSVLCQLRKCSTMTQATKCLIACPGRSTVRYWSAAHDLSCGSNEQMALEAARTLDFRQDKRSPDMMKQSKILAALGIGLAFLFSDVGASKRSKIQSRPLTSHWSQMRP